MPGIIKEELLHYVWKVKNFDLKDLKTSENSILKIHSFGVQNHHDGPDFLEAMISIDDIVWVGNVEMHVHSSDWIKHGHQKDPKYQNVILHVVYYHDTDIWLENGLRIPCIELKHRISGKLIKKFHSLKQNQLWVPCASHLINIPPIVKSHVKNKALASRLELKAAKMIQELNLLGGNLSELIYRNLALSFGLKANTVGFIQLVQNLPFTLIQKHTSSLLQLEALFFGQAGLLPKESENPYVQKLIVEFSFLRRKYNLIPISAQMWNFGSIMPNAFPSIRLAQFAKYIFLNPRFDLSLFEKDKMDLLRSFSVNTSLYWNTHYRFGRTSVSRVKSIGKNKCEVILINAVVPILFAYGIIRNLDTYKDRAIELLEGLKSEKNQVITKWNRLGMESITAGDSQALLQLKSESCNNFLCLKCPVGHFLLSSPNHFK